MARQNKGVQAILFGPDTKHGATVKSGATRYIWYAVWYEKGQRRLRSLDREYGQVYQDALESARADFYAQQVASHRVKGLTDAPVGAVLAAYLSAKADHVFDAEGLARRVELLAHHFGNMMVSEIAEEDCRAFAASRPSRGTARLELGALGAALNYAHKQRLIKMPLPPVWMPEAPPGRDRVLSRTEIARIVWHFRSRASSRHFAVATLIAYRTSARIQSVLWLRWDQSPAGGHVDLKRGLIHLNPEGREKTNKLKPTIPIHKKLRALLRGIHRRRRNLPVCAGARGVTPSARIFREAWRKACRKLNINGTRPHDLRHSAITHMLEGGANHVFVSEVSGLDISTLMGRYKHIMPDRLSSALDTY
jgi:integrase